MKSMSEHNGRMCPNTNCRVVIFYKNESNECPSCSTIGMIVTKFSMKIKVN